MKTILLTLSAFVFGSVMFAQSYLIETGKAEKNYLTTDIRSTWVGGGFDSYYTGSVAGDEFYIAGSEFEQIEVGNQITKVKFYHVLGTVHFESGDITFNNTSYTIKIYENPALGGPYVGFGFYSTAIGTPVYTQTVTLGAGESDEIYELTLTTPYTVNENDFWVAVCFDNGKGAMRLGAEDALSEGQYYMYFDGSAYGAGTVIGKPNFGSFSEPAYHPIGISLYVDDGNPYEEQSDLTMKFIDTYPTPNAYIDAISIDDTEDLVIYPVIVNNGVDATSEHALLSATIGGEPLFSDVDIDLSGIYSLPDGYYTTIYAEGAMTITASELDNMEMTGIFDICFTISYNGLDPVSANNTGCITVTRGEILPTSCDMEALFVTSNTDFNPIPTAVTIDITEDMTVFPAVKNNGPDNANNMAEVEITIVGTPVDFQNLNMTGLENGETIPVSEAGYTMTADMMDLLSLTVFDVCLTVTYAGTDSNTENNTVCTTVTRSSVGINNSAAGSVSLYPNPATDVITILNAEKQNIYILNTLGETVSVFENAASNQTIDISTLSNGTYFVRVDDKVFKLNVVK
ncbi:MAG TPA: T9SS type A sorting domain-containing protein [Bacteroidales bacterium]|nr:T9SS type A sorting domain-containing protein [Bacteroidales bacterium]